MLIFWLAAAALMVLTLWFILPALLKPESIIKNNANNEKRAIFKQQFVELEQDKANGVLDDTQYIAAKGELERRLLDELGGEEVVATTVAPDKRLGIVFFMLFPLMAVLLYLKLGNPDAILIPVVAPNSAMSVVGDPQHNTMAGDIEPLLGALKSKLENKPEDGAGWALLARSYVEIRRHAEAVSAYEKAVKIIPDDPQLLADYADALAVVNGHDLAGKPEEMVSLALKLDPHHVKALMLAATAAFNRKDYKQAIGFWERLQQDLPAGSEMLPEVKASLDEAHTLLGGKALAPTIKKEVAAKVSGVSGTVRVSKAMASKVDPAATVFIFARATQGPPMPLAIVRTTARDLPYTYHLDDSSALMPDLKLSQASEVVLVARISKTGDAKAQPGDLQGMSAAVRPDGRTVDIEINQQN